MTLRKFTNRISLLLIVIILAAAVSGACSQGQAKSTVRIGTLKGPTGLGMVKLMDDQSEAKTKNDYQFTLAGAPDEIVASLSSGQIDIAALPTNLAAVLYQKTDQEVLMLAVNTLGVLYVLENGDSVQAIADLAGKTLEATGQAAVPEYALNYLLAENNLLDDVTVNFRSEHTELATLAASGQVDLAMLPEPFVTTVLARNPDFRVALDLTQEWQKLQQQAGSDSELAMGCLVVNKEFAENNREALRSFLDEYKQSTEYVNDNHEQAGELAVKFEILADAVLAARSIPNCNIVLIEGEAMQPILDPFYEVLFAANPQSVGGATPDTGFYWIP